MPQRKNEIRLYTDPSGQIWFKERGREPRQTQLSPESLARQSWLLDAQRVMLLAHHNNSDIITALYSAKRTVGSPVRVLLGNPRLCPKRRLEVPSVFFSMDGWELPPSLGGWRELTDKDYVTYALAGVLRKSEDETCSNLVERLLRAHPAWPALSFLSGLDKYRACELICTILDPRWHVDPAKPDARKRLQSTFGLGREGVKNVAHVLVGGPQHPAGYNSSLANLVLDAWAGTGSGEPCLPPDPVLLRPQDFLWRIACKRPAGFKGMVRACRVFLSFVCDVWLDNLTSQRTYGPAVRKTSKDGYSRNYPQLCPCASYSPQLFVAGHFFELAAEVQAWHEHIDRLKQRSV